MANRVTIHSNLQSKFRKKVLDLCTKVLFYDHGYKKVQGVSNLDSTWGARLIADAYETGSNPRPLQGRGKGRVSIIDKVEMLEPGLVRKHYRYAEKTIGNQASFENLARTMTLKAKAEGKVLPGGVAIRYNKTSLHRWFKSQGGKDKSAKEKPFLTADQKREQKKWCHEEKKQKQMQAATFTLVSSMKSGFTPPPAAAASRSCPLEMLRTLTK